MPGAPASAAELGPHLDRVMTAMRPWATGTRFLKFAERWSSLETVIPDDALKRLTRTRAALDPDRLLIAPHQAPDPDEPAAPRGARP